MIAGLIVILPSADAVYIKPERIEVTKKEHLRPTSYREKRSLFKALCFSSDRCLKLYRLCPKITMVLHFFKKKPLSWLAYIFFDGNILRFAFFVVYLHLNKFIVNYGTENNYCDFIGYSLYIILCYKYKDLLL
jgi:hypothetical protein